MFFKKLCVFKIRLKDTESIHTNNFITNIVDI